MFRGPFIGNIYVTQGDKRHRYSNVIIIVKELHVVKMATLQNGQNIKVIEILDKILIVMLI